MKYKLLLFYVLLVFSFTTHGFVVYEDTRIWNQDSITFYFLDGTEQQQNEVKTFAKLWQRYTGIQFKYSHKKLGLLNFRRYYKITFTGNKNESTRGAVNGTINLGNLSDDIIFRKTTILHEFGHMLGLGHEHQRQDRPHSINDSSLISACQITQKQSKQWCRKNLNNKDYGEVFIESEYDSMSIMHYSLNNITGANLQLLENLPDSNANSLSYTDKYYIAMLYNQNISDTTLKKMHKQDLWNQKIFENKTNKDREKAIMSLTSSSCKPLEYPNKTQDGKFCEDGFMIVGQDDFSFPGDDFKTCYLNFNDIKEKILTHKYCQLTSYRLAQKRKTWGKKSAQFGNCKRLETLQKNKQEYFCDQGFSFVTLNNNMIGQTTQCFSSQESTFKAMQESDVCNMDNYHFRKYKSKTKALFQKQLKTKHCQIVEKKYKTISCPEDFDYTIVHLNDKTKPINNHCFATQYQALNTMKNITQCY